MPTNNNATDFAETFRLFNEISRLPPDQRDQRVNAPYKNNQNKQNTLYPSFLRLFPLSPSHFFYLSFFQHFSSFSYSFSGLLLLLLSFPFLLLTSILFHFVRFLLHPGGRAGAKILPPFHVNISISPSSLYPNTSKHQQIDSSYSPLLVDVLGCACGWEFVMGLSRQL